MMVGNVCQAAAVIGISCRFQVYFICIWEILVRLQLHPPGSVKNISDGREILPFIGSAWDHLLAAGVFLIRLVHIRSDVFHGVGFHS